MSPSFGGHFFLKFRENKKEKTHKKRVKRQATYMMSGLEEGLSMTIAVTADMVMDTHQREKTEENVEQRMAHKIRTDYKEEIELKFVSFEQFLTKKGEKNEIAKAFLFRRFMTIILVRT